MNEATGDERTLLPYEVIIAAASGDIDAINSVLNHYRAYITLLSTRDLYDEFGNRYVYLDEEKVQMLEIQLITKILCFRADEIA